MKTSEMTGPALDWAVAKCEGLLAFGHETDGERLWITLSTGETELFAPTCDWSQGGPIIERERITMQFDGDGIHTDLTTRDGKFYQGFDEYKPLVAALRCYVASKLGDEVDIPAELTIE
jgi:hypothetical protein